MFSPGIKILGILTGKYYIVATVKVKYFGKEGFSGGPAERAQS